MTQHTMRLAEAVAALAATEGIDDVLAIVVVRPNSDEFTVITKEHTLVEAFEPAATPTPVADTHAFLDHRSTLDPPDPSWVRDALGELRGVDPTDGNR